MNRYALGIAGAIAGVSLIVGVAGDRVALVEAADHADGIDAMGTAASDVTDNFAWVWDDNGTASLAMIMNVTGASFADNIQYAWTLVRDPLGTPTVSQMICQFESNAGNEISCAYGDAADFTVASGDPSGATGLTDNGIRVFAGPRDDPFFFNLDGFVETAAGVRGADLGALGVTVDANGCPDLANSDPVGDFNNVAAAVATCLTTSCDQGFGAAPQDGTPVDFFAGNAVQSIVVSIPLSMIPGSTDVVAVSASTHVAP